MSRHEPPFAPQSRHWYWKLIGAEPAHVPGLAASVLPTVRLPLIVGAELLDGAEADRAVAPLTATRPASAARARPRIDHFMVDLLLAKRCSQEIPCAGLVKTAFYRLLTVAYALFTVGNPGVSSTRPSARIVIA